MVPDGSNAAIEVYKNPSYVFLLLSASALFAQLVALVQQVAVGFRVLLKVEMQVGLAEMRAEL